MLRLRMPFVTLAEGSYNGVIMKLKWSYERVYVSLGFKNRYLKVSHIKMIVIVLELTQV